MSRKRELLSRVYMLLVVFVAIALILMAKAALIYLSEGDVLREKSRELYYRVDRTDAERGQILADDGSPLATSQPIFEMRMDLAAKGLDDPTFYAGLDSLALCVRNLTYPERSVTQVRNMLQDARRKRKRYLLIGKNLNYEQMLAVKRFPVLRLGPNRGGLIVQSETRRIKPYKNLASRTVGLNRSNSEAVGLEKSYDVYLRGEGGSRVVRKVSGNLYLPVDGLDEILPHKGSDVITTINPGIQEVAELALSEALHKHQAEGGCAIVMEVETGAIKAIANLQRNPEGTFTEVYNYAVAHSTEPGSTFKLAALLALVDGAGVDTSAAVDLMGGACNFYGHAMKDSRIHGRGMSDLADAFALSSNVGISRLTVQHFGQDPARYIAYLRKLGLGDKTGIDLDGEPAPVIKDPQRDKKNWYGTTLPWMSVGYEVKLTPLQLLTLYNVVASGGKRVSPHLVSAIDNGRDVTTLPHRCKSDSLIAPGAREKVLGLLKAVVERGTASNIQTDAYAIAGKTGTAVTNYSDRDALQKSYQASFAGFFPADAPVYSCIVVVYNPSQTGFYGAEVAAPVFRRIADRCMRAEFLRSAVVNLEDKQMPSAAHLPSQNKGHLHDFKQVFSIIGLPFLPVGKSDWVETYVSDEGISAAPQKLQRNYMPDLQGMGLRDACFLMDEYEVRVVPSGSGKILRQSIPPGSLIQGHIVEVLLQ
ncbi:MAG: transpeptidase family protein [Saprospiraceae bacterium]|jgi:cell division protein FtsI (penicillin-binding protein 3)|nr:transpeptidase family protein [Saprospiraceae bacterium]MBP9210500.1 transpeptidase family protein [Saprospiraceae bacterium]MBV6472598.1 Peptidoglycan D,D-transpeptidase FtsI [Saprospiraceae bacterium]